MITYVIMGKPTPLSRPRFSPISKRVFDPQKEPKLLAAIALQSQHYAQPLYTGALHLEVTFYMPITERSERIRKQYIGQPHTKKVDLDNMLKFVNDVWINILYKDDASIASIVAKKVYDLTPRTEFTLRRMED